MKKPEELVELIETLREEVTRPSGSYDTGAHITVYVGKGEFNVAAPDAIYLLHSEQTVQRFFEAIGSPDDTGIELHSFDVEDEVKSTLDSLFSTVDDL